MTSKDIEYRPALIIIDMVKDNFDERRNLPITPFARKIIPPINTLIRIFRERKLPIVFATDAFQTRHFFFSGRMKPHSLAGTTGAEVIDELDRREEDYRSVRGVYITRNHHLVIFVGWYPVHPRDQNHCRLVLNILYLPNGAY